MGKGKLAKFAEMAANPLVIEPRYNPNADTAHFELQGHWAHDFFHNDNPIILELGCGRGEYTVGLAQQNPHRNYIGIDIKGSRMWTGATQAHQSGMTNVAFLRTNIEFVWQFFAPNEVSEIWLTFSDPQMKKATKRLTSTHFLSRYRRFLADQGIIHLKTDSNFLFTYTQEMLRANHITPEVSTRDLYSDTTAGIDEARSLQTYYESMWRSRGIDIKYLRFRLPQQGELTEPEVEIELDEYRSYSREKRSELTKHK